VYLPQAKAEVSPASMVGYRSLADDLTASIALPKEIGKIQEIYRGMSDKIVVLIQDAHSIPDAQRSIRSAIDHFQTQYGVSLVGLEGASEKLDPQIFRSFPDKELLRKTFDAYAQRGELTGGTTAALFNTSSSAYHGIEDWPLYEQGVSYFLKATAMESEIKILLDPMVAALDREKANVYSKELLEIDRLLAGFGENKTDLMQVLNQLSKYQPPPKGSELTVLLEEIQRDQIIDTPIEIEIKKIAEQVMSALRRQSSSSETRQELQEFSGKLQEFRTARMTPQAFALYLKGLVQKHKIRVKVSRKLAYLVENQKKLKDIEGTRLFEEFKLYADSVKESIFQNDRQKTLDIQTRGVELIKRLARLELSFEDWGKVQKLISQLDRWTVAQDGVVSRDEVSAILKKMETHLAFYRVAEQRDQVFLKNIQAMMEKQGKSSSVLVAGGFHTEGLTQTLKAKGISYVLVMPWIGAIPEEPLYREHMQGQVSWSNYFEVKDGKVDLYDAFVRATRDKLLGDKDASANGGKEWRDQIIRDLAADGRIMQASEYTRFIDETTQPSSSSAQSLREKWLANIDRFGEGLKKLQDEGNLSESSILQLIKTITIPAVANGADILNPDARAEIRLLPWIKNQNNVKGKKRPTRLVRSEARGKEMVGEVYEIQKLYQWEKLLRDVDDDAKLFILPYLWVSSHKTTKKEFLDHIKQDQQSYIPLYAPGTEALLKKTKYSDGTIGYAVLIGEPKTLQIPESASGVITAYHNTPLDSAKLIAKHGFYQLPGRWAFTLLPPRGVGSIGNAILAFDLPAHEIVVEKGESDGQLAFNLSPSQLHYLPSEVSAHTQIARGSSLKENPLGIANEFGMLVRVAPEKINIEATRKANEERVRNGEFLQEDFEALMSSLVRPGTAGNGEQVQRQEVRNEQSEVEVKSRSESRENKESSANAASKNTEEQIVRNHLGSNGTLFSRDEIIAYSAHVAAGLGTSVEIFESIELQKEPAKRREIYGMLNSATPSSPPDNFSGMIARVNSGIQALFPEAQGTSPDQFVFLDENQTLIKVVRNDTMGFTLKGQDRMVIPVRNKKPIDQNLGEWIYTHETLHLLFPGFLDRGSNEAITEYLTEKILSRDAYAQRRQPFFIEAFGNAESYERWYALLKKLLKDWDDKDHKLEQALMRSYQTGDLSILNRVANEVSAEKLPENVLFVVLSSLEMFEPLLRNGRDLESAKALQMVINMRSQMIRMRNDIEKQYPNGTDKTDVNNLRNDLDAAIQETKRDIPQAIGLLVTLNPERFDQKYQGYAEKFNLVKPLKLERKLRSESRNVEKQIEIFSDKKDIERMDRVFRSLDALPPEFLKKVRDETGNGPKMKVLLGEALPDGKAVINGFEDEVLTALIRVAWNLKQLEKNVREKKDDISLSLMDFSDFLPFIKVPCVAERLDKLNDLPWNVLGGELSPYAKELRVGLEARWNLLQRRISSIRQGVMPLPAGSFALALAPVKALVRLRNDGIFCWVGPNDEREQVFRKHYKVPEIIQVEVTKEGAGFYAYHVERVAVERNEEERSLGADIKVGGGEKIEDPDVIKTIFKLFDATLSDMKDVFPEMCARVRRNYPLLTHYYYPETGKRKSDVLKEAGISSDEAGREALIRGIFENGEKELASMEEPRSQRLREAMGQIRNAWEDGRDLGALTRTFAEVDREFLGGVINRILQLTEDDKSPGGRSEQREKETGSISAALSPQALRERFGIPSDVPIPDSIMPDLIALKKWVNGPRSPRAQELRQQMADFLVNEGHVSFEAFMLALDEAVEKFNQVLKGRPPNVQNYAVVFDQSTHKSSRWIYELIKHKLIYPPMAEMYSEPAKIDNAVRAFGTSSEPDFFVFFDDAFFSGERVLDVFGNIQRVYRSYGEVPPEEFYAVAPFAMEMTAQKVRDGFAAGMAYPSPGKITLIHSRIIPSVADAVPGAEAADNFSLTDPSIGSERPLSEWGWWYTDSNVSDPLSCPWLSELLQYFKPPYGKENTAYYQNESEDYSKGYIILPKQSEAVAKSERADGRSEQRVVDETSEVIAGELADAVNPVNPKPVAGESLQLIALKINSGEVDPETLKHTMTKVMAESRGIYKDHLVAKGVSAEDAEAMVEKFRVYHGKLLAFLSNLPKNGTISVGLMIDPKSSHSFLTRFVAALKQVQGVSVEVIAPASVLNDPLLRTKDISGVLKMHPVRGFSRATVAAGQNEVPLAVDPTSEGQRGVLAEMFRAFRLDFTAIPDQNTLLRDAIEETLATMILVSPDIMEEDGYKSAQSLALKAAYLKGRLNEIFKKDMFGEPGGDGSLTLIGTKVQEYIASLETQKAA